jgi:hypothetical protein
VRFGVRNSKTPDGQKSKGPAIIKNLSWQTTFDREAA